MKSIALATTIALTAFSGGVMAACSGTALTQSQLSTLLTNATVCVAKVGGGWEAQEQHFSDGVLKDYKLGPDSTVDPTEVMGTWSLTTVPGKVTHAYNGGGGTFNYTVYPSGDGYSFCGLSNVEVTVKPGVAAGC